MKCLREGLRQPAILKGLGFLPTFTCSPYLVGVLSRPGNVLCWTGSGGEIASNSFFGARAGRESAATCFAAAVTGKTPQMGLLIKAVHHGKTQNITEKFQNEQVANEIIGGSSKGEYPHNSV